LSFGSLLEIVLADLWIVTVSKYVWRPLTRLLLCKVMLWKVSYMSILKPLPQNNEKSKPRISLTQIRTINEHRFLRHFKMELAFFPFT
jgi:hypothetical protein